MPDARLTALQILTFFDQHRGTLDQALESMHDETSLFSKRDRALIHALVFGVIRWQKALDWIVAHYSKTPLRKIEPTVLHILRIGIFQILYMDRIPDSAAVNTCVEMGKQFGKPWVARYINGLLRNVARDRSHIPFPPPEKDFIQHLAVFYSYPGWLIKKWLRRYTREETISLCEAGNRIPPITIRTNILKTSRKKLEASLKREVKTLHPTIHSPLGLQLTAPSVSIPEMDAYSKGWFQVQDEAAQLVSMMAAPLPGQIVLDACAGLGGKTAHLAQMMKNHGKLIALDNSMEKLKKLELEMPRLGIDIVEAMEHDLHDPVGKKLSTDFDHVLLDAPCSGLGVIRRNPDIKWAESKKNLAGYQKRQVQFLHNLSGLVKPGGRLTFSVCSFEEEETEQVVELFLKDHPTFQLEDRSGDLPGSIKAAIYCDRCLRTYPHRDDMDGFFAACFRNTTA